MLNIRAGFSKFRLNFKHGMQYSSSNTSTNYPDLMLQPKFSNAEKEKILSILNGSNSDQLMCFNIAQNKIRNLENYKKRKGPFKSLDELLDVDGLSVKTLEKLCKQIITDTAVQNGKSVNNDNKKIKQLFVPQLPSSVIDTLGSSVGIHLAPMGVSWAKIINPTNELESWGYQDYGNLPKKLCPVDTFKLAMSVLSQIPCGDVYVFEGANGMGLQGQKQPATVATYTLHLELSSMLLALINTSRGHNKGYQDDLTKYDTLSNCVYFLRPKLPASRE
ncbi:uncharacterized protein LOC135134917 isoform X2 [Zophobas morio]|uniref:uncharacterized protein LOC135134917 isoform X2 n=1 Tax=Zophobas morio TaxID=2755281 RepID=UPI003083ABFD